MTTMYKATVLIDNSESEYTTVYEKIHAKEEEANEAIKKVFGNVKYVRPIKVDD
jgi:hypothetical protein